MLTRVISDEKSCLQSLARPLAMVKKDKYPNIENDADHRNWCDIKLEDNIFSNLNEVNDHIDLAEQKIKQLLKIIDSILV